MAKTILTQEQKEKLLTYFKHAVDVKPAKDGAVLVLYDMNRGDDDE